MAELDLQYLEGVLKRMQEGDDYAFAEFYTATYEKQYLFAWVFLKDEKRAREALVETYHQAYETIRMVKDARLLITWLRQTNFRCCYNIEQKERLVSGLSADRREEDFYAIKAVMALPYSESQAVFLRYARGLSLREIALIMGVSTNLVSEYLDRGCGRLLTKPVMEESSALRKRPDALSEDEAQEILDEVLEAAGKTPCQVPITVMTDYIVYRKDRYGLQKTLLMIVMILFIILPVFFVTPKLTMTQEGESFRDMYGNLKVSALLPVADVEALIDGKPMGVRNMGNGEYRIHPTCNGNMQIKVTLWNRQFSQIAKTVDFVDTQRPELLGNYVENGELVILASDDKSGIDYNMVYWVDEEGSMQLPLRSDAATGEIVFPVPEGAVVIYLADRCGNMLKLSVALK